MEITTIGLDLAKNVFQVHGVDTEGTVVLRRKLRRSDLITFFGSIPPVLIGMEACGGAHFWARELAALGHEVRLMPPAYVKPYVKRGKTDAADAEAICEAMGRPHMRFVAIKTVAQQDVQSAQAAHRIRSELVQQRTAKANQIRGLVGEYGLVTPTGIGQLRAAMPRWLEDAENGLTDDFRILLAGLADDLRYLDERIATVTERIEQHAQTDPLAKRLMALCGVGTLTASALAGALGNAQAFKRGRDFAASLGLTPRQHSTGGRDRLLGISKRGDSYLRTLLIHGARAALRWNEGREDNLSLWVRQLAVRKHPNVAIIALANKTARIAWAITRHDRTYDPDLAAQAA